MAEAWREMPRYRCHKVVHALRLRRVDDTGDVPLLVPEDPDFAPFGPPLEWWSRFRPTAADDDPGYYVVYEDGYVSWSPTVAFEKGYALAE